jgi:hypothetical protein
VAHVSQSQSPGSKLISDKAQTYNPLRHQVFLDIGWNGSESYNSDGIYTGVFSLTNVVTPLKGEWIEINYNTSTNLSNIDLGSSSGTSYAVVIDNRLVSFASNSHSFRPNVTDKVTIVCLSNEQGYSQLTMSGINLTNEVLVNAPVSTSFTRKLTNGFYDVNSFVQHLQEVLAGVFDVTFNETTKRLVFTGESSTLYESSAYPLLGLVGDHSGGEAPRSVNLAPHRTFNISIDGRTHINQSNRTGHTFVVPIKSDVYEYTYYEPQTFIQYMDIHSDKRIIDLQVRDDNGRIMDLNGCDWSVILERVD